MIAVRIVGIDPGGTTGAFIVDLRRQDNGRWYTEAPDHEEIKSPPGVNVGSFVWAAFSSWDHERSGMVIGCERFIPNPHQKTNQPDALEQTGVVKYVCAAWRTEPVMVTKANAMKLCNNDRLRAIGWWGRGKTHANDAARVALAALHHAHPAIFTDLVRDTIPVV